MEYCPYCMAELTGPYCIRCGKRADEVQNGFNLPVGTTLCRQRYVVGRVLGQGGFGVTYLGRDTWLNRAVAIKEYVPSCCSYRDKKSQWIVPFPEQAHQEFYEKGKGDFLEEVRLATEVSGGRQHIVEIYDYFEENNTAYLVMEYLNGDSMQDFVKAHGPYEPAYLFSLMRPLMQDLAEIHKRNVLHRDIAPNNIMHIKSNRLKLIDFGAARRLHGDRTMSIMVHDGYAPPEQFMKKDQGPYTDVYALAATMYFCLTGEIPRTSIARVQAESLPSLLKKRVKVTQQQNDAIMHALCLRMDERTQDMQQFMDELYGRSVTTEEKQPNPIGKILEMMKKKHEAEALASAQEKTEEDILADGKPDPQPIPEREAPQESEKPDDQNDHLESRTEPAEGYGPPVPAQNPDPVQSDKTLPADLVIEPIKDEPVKVEPIKDEPAKVEVPVYNPVVQGVSGTGPSLGQKIPDRPRPSPEREVPEYHPVTTPRQPMDKRLMVGFGAVLLVLLILILIPAISMAKEREKAQAGQTNSVEVESKQSVESLAWLSGYWYLFDEKESCAEYQIQSDGSWTKSRRSVNSDRKQNVSTGTVTVVDKDEVIIDQLQWKYQKDNDCLEPSGQNEQTENMMHFDERLTLEQLQRNSGRIVELSNEVKSEPEPEPELESGSSGSADWVLGYWYHFNKTQKTCEEYYVNIADGSCQKRVRSINSDRATNVSTGSFAIVDENEVLVEQIQWTYNEQNDYLVRYKKNGKWECIMHYDKQLTLEQLQSQFDLVMELYKGPEPETIPEPESESSWLDGYWYLFNEEGKYCTEYQFQEDGTYQVQERVLANGNNRTRVKDGEYSYVEKTVDQHAQLFLEDETWKYDEEVGAWYKKEDNIWGTKSQIVMIHSLSRAGVDELAEGYATFMMYNEVDVYEYDGVADSETILMYTYPSVFQEITTENETYADGTAMKPLEVFLTSINSYWGYRSEDRKQALFYSFRSIPSDFEAKDVLQSIADKVHCDFMIEEESASEADWFRLLMKINGRWHFIRCVIFEENNELVLMEYSFTGESYYDYNSVIAHLEHNLKYITE